MGRYATWSGDVLPRYGELETIFANRWSDAASQAAAADSAFVFYAERELEARLAPRYSVPFSADNVTARELAIELTYLKAVRPDDEGKTKQVREAVDRRIAALLAGTEFMLTDSLGTLGQAAPAAWSNTYGHTPTFGIEGPLEWAVDSDALLAQELERL